ncbi:hypothetical protein CDAR_450541 [Caerostris darwini]|uniref:Uncharacterized protein n=1 Tax=Caerostris darwini TaxID=1538125 RepID=A0AAV4WN56_9ARAC|nr:hypothetical protein CDAR_450541 [Caerostris darwini]
MDWHIVNNLALYEVSEEKIFMYSQIDQRTDGHEILEDHRINKNTHIKEMMADGGRPWRNCPWSVLCSGSYRSSWDTFLDEE